MNLIFTAKNTVISPNFLVWKFCGKVQFRIVSGEITVFSAEKKTNIQVFCYSFYSHYTKNEVFH